MFDHYMDKFAPKIVDLSVNFAQASLRVVLLVIGAIIAVKLLRAGINKLEPYLIRAGEFTETVPGAAEKRIKTLTGVLWTIAVVVLWFIVILSSLGQLGIDVGPILAGAGVVGLAVGFGAQNLVRDLVSGFFIILENHIRVGDVAVLNGTAGLVEKISFRTVVLRDLSGIVHVFPNGTIATLSNVTKDWSAYVIDVGVAYKEDTDHVTEIMQKVGDEMKADPKYGSVMLDTIEIFGVDDFADSAVTIKARFRTLPLQQFFIGREYRRRLKKAFDAAGIEIPFPHRTLYMGEASPPFQVAMNAAELQNRPSN